MTLPAVRSAKPSRNGVSERPFRMGHALQNTLLPFDLTMDMLHVHMAVLGGSGTGKSKFLELLIRYLLLLGEGGLYIDPASDTASDLASFVLHLVNRGESGTASRTHFLEVLRNRLFRFDPFASLPSRSAVGSRLYYDILSTKVDRMARTILRSASEADLDIMNRLKRWLKNVLYCCGVEYAPSNTHVGLHKALVFTNPAHPEFEALFDPVYPHLPSDVQEDFKKLIDTKRPLDRERWAESTINKLRDIMRPAFALMFEPGAASFDMATAVQRGDFVIAAMGQSPWWSHDQKVIVSGFLIDAVLDVKEAEESQLPADERKRFTLIIDECGEVLGEDLNRALGSVRKYKMPMVLAAQNLDKFCKGKLDMGQEVMAECQVKVIFQQRDDDNLERIVRCIGHGNIDLTERNVEVQRQRGLIAIPMEDHSVSTNQGRNSSLGISHSASDSSAKSHSTSEQVQEQEASSWSTSEGQAKSKGTSHSNQRVESNGVSVGVHSSEQHGSTPIIEKGKVVGEVPTSSRSSGKSSSTQSSLAIGETWGTNQSTSTTNSTTKGGSTARSTGHGSQEGSTEQTAQSAGATMNQGESEGSSQSVTYKTQLVPNVVSEFEQSGQLEQGQLDVQWERLFQQVHGLDCGQAVVKIPTNKEAFAVKIAWLNDLWHGKARSEAIKLGKKLLMERQEYTFVPPRDLQALTDEYESRASSRQGSQLPARTDVTSPFDE